MDLSLSHSLSPVAAAEAAPAVVMNAGGREQTQAQTAVPSYSGSTAGSLSSMAGSLVLVLALIFAFAWLMRWMQGARASRGTGLRIEGGVQLGAKERVVVLQAGDSRLLLGVTAGQITLLQRLGDSVEEVVEPAEAGPNPSFQQAFGEQLNKLLGRK